jgi:serine O-acetyltransferase
MIAPNAFVNVSVPSNSLVVGNPAVVMPREDATDGYINFTNTD